MKNKTLIMFIIFAIPFVAKAQNDIDEMIGRFSTIGSSTYSSIVQRNPKTHNVEKVVKKLTTGGINHTKELIKTFNKESKRHKTTTTNREDDTCTTIFTTEDAKSNRIYMIKYDTNRICPNVTVTVIVKIKQ